jgi:hypothetical protein
VSSAPEVLGDEEGELAALTAEWEAVEAGDEAAGGTAELEAAEEEEATALETAEEVGEGEDEEDAEVEGVVEDEELLQGRVPLV